MSELCFKKFIHNQTVMDLDKCMRRKDTVNQAMVLAEQKNKAQLCRISNGGKELLI